MTTLHSAHAGVVNEASTSLRTVAKMLSQSWRDDRLDELLSLLERGDSITQSESGQILTIVRRSAGIPAAMATLCSISSSMTTRRRVVYRLRDVALQNVSAETVVRVVCALNSMRVIVRNLGSGSESFSNKNLSGADDIFDASYATALRRMDDADYSVRSAAINLFGTTVRQSLGGIRVKWGVRALNSPTYATVCRRWPNMSSAMSSVLLRRSKNDLRGEASSSVSSSSTGLVTVLAFIRQLTPPEDTAMVVAGRQVRDIDAIARERRTRDVSVAILRVARHSSSWRVRENAAYALASVLAKKAMLEVIRDEVTRLVRADVTVRDAESSAGENKIAVFRNSNAVHASLLVLRSLLSELAVRDDQDKCASSTFVLARECVANMLVRPSIWTDPNVHIACEPLVAEFWRVLGIVVLPDACFDGHVVGADATRVLGAHHLRVVAPPYGALGKLGGIDNVRGGWHAQTLCPFPVTLLFESPRSFDRPSCPIESAKSWDARQPHDSRVLRVKSSRLVVRRIRAVRLRAAQSDLDLERPSLLSFHIRSTLLESALTHQKLGSESELMHVLRNAAANRRLWSPHSEIWHIFPALQMLAAAFPRSLPKLVDVAALKEILEIAMKSVASAHEDTPRSMRRAYALTISRTLVLLERATSSKDQIDASLDACSRSVSNIFNCTEEDGRRLILSNRAKN